MIVHEPPPCQTIGEPFRIWFRWMTTVRLNYHFQDLRTSTPNLHFRGLRNTYKRILGHLEQIPEIANPMKQQLFSLSSTVISNKHFIERSLPL